jgi:aryl-alcohol dehydrogenase-like predicted oxidoreductase
VHKDYLGARFARHLAAVREIVELGNRSGLSCPQLCIGVLLRTPGMTGCIVGARDAQQGALIASLGASVTDEQAAAVWAVAARLEQDLARM